LENRSLEFALIGEFLIDLKKEFSNGNDELVKIAELKRKKTINFRVQKRDEWSFLEKINGSRIFFQKY